VMQDLWRGSDPESPRGDPLWRSRPGSALVGWWWALYLASVFRIFFVNRDDGPLLTDGDLRALRNEDLVAAFSMAATVAAALLLLVVIRRLTRRQRECIGALPPAA
jgi:Domain of unknown function (DUF4328)